jgi:hypothetical protein
MLLIKGDAATSCQFLTDGIPPDKQNICEVNPSCRMGGSGYAEIVEALFATTTIDVNVQSVAGQTPLFFTLACGYPKVVRVFLDRC